MSKYHKYTAEEISFLKKIIPGRSAADAGVLFNARFYPRVIRESQVKAFMKNYRTPNGRDTRFQPGRVSHNKGKKGYCPPGSEKGWFKPGHNTNRRPIGSERINILGYVEVKVSDTRSRQAKVRQKNWKSKHSVVWEKSNGPIPKGHIVIFADGNRFNFSLDNLLLVSRRAHGTMCCNRLYSRHKSLTMTGIAVASLKMAIADRKRELKRKRKKRGAG